MASYMDAVEGKHTDGREQEVVLTDTQVMARMLSALQQIDHAVNLLSKVDGMESISDELNVQASLLEDEIAEFKSVMEAMK